jgi:glycosyltransferase involved in cell wall biosynthesis
MFQLSAVIITFNESAKIGRCIDSLADLADEILVVDSCSTDDTVAICEQKGARVIIQPFLGYIEQKNFAMKQAKNEIILSLDADEALSVELLNSIKKLKQEGNFSGAATMNRLTNYCGYWVRYGGWYPDTKLRLADRKIATWAGVNPHDKLEVKNNIKPFWIKGDILHYSYDSLNDHLEQIKRFSSIGAEALFRKGERSNLFKILINPIARFVRNYILRRGFMDGFFGYVIARNSSHAVFLKYVKLYLLQQQKHKTQ